MEKKVKRRRVGSCEYQKFCKQGYIKSSRRYSSLSWWNGQNYWINSQKFILARFGERRREYIRNCNICKSTKAPNYNLKPEMCKQGLSIRPIQRLYIDLLGPYPRSKSGCIGLLTVLDHLTKFHWLFPMKKLTSTTIKEHLQKEIFDVFGVPENDISDNGSQFRANDFSAFLTIIHIYRALYSPQSNASERQIHYCRH